MKSCGSLFLVNYGYVTDLGSFFGFVSLFVLPPFCGIDSCFVFLACYIICYA